MNWEGVNPLWSVVPIAFLALHGFMQGVHEKLSALETERNKLLVETGKPPIEREQIFSDDPRFRKFALASAVLVAVGLFAAGLVVVGAWFGREYLTRVEVREPKFEFTITPGETVIERPNGAEKSSNQKDPDAKSD